MKYGIVILIALMVMGASVFMKRTGTHVGTVIDTRTKQIVTVTPTPVRKKVALSVDVPILMYHYVEVVTDPKDTIRKSLDLLPATFDRQISTLLDHGYTPIFMSDLSDVLSGHRALPPKPIVLTFDDGYRDFYTDVFPILKKYHVKATSYVVSGFLDTTKNYMTKDMVVEISQSGLVEIGAHTVHHRNLKGLPPQIQTSEMLESKKFLETLTHKPVTDFAYPYGSFDNASVVAVASVGFQSAVTTAPGAFHTPTQQFALTRLRPAARTGDTLVTWLERLQK